MVYYTGLENKTRHTASAKAPSDIEELCRRKGYSYIPIARPSEKLPDFLQKVWKYLNSVRYWNSVLNRLEKGDILIYQNPLYVNHALSGFEDRLKHKGIKLIVLIHDLESLRKGIDGVIGVNESSAQLFEGKLLKKFDAVICHNDKMKKYLIEQGYDKDRLVSLEIFDYLTDAEIPERKRGDKPSVAIAGNLHPGKCGYIYRITEDGHNSGLELNLFGVNFDENSSAENLVYHGSFHPSDLPVHLKGDFGLVWDGPSAEACTGNTGEYLKYNNPHKTSLYLASGMPVIVWSKAAIADFVLKNKVGIAVDSLYDAEKTIAGLSDKEYYEMCKNAKLVSGELRSGNYFYTALEDAFDKAERSK